MRYECELIEAEPQPALAMRRSARSTEVAQALSEALPAAWQHARDRGIQLAGPPFTRFLDMEEDRLELQAGFPTFEHPTGSGKVDAIVLPGGQILTALHYGPYEDLNYAYEAMLEWMEENGKEPAGTPWEVYVTDPGEEPDSSRWQTRVHWPVQ
ncbi:MAG: GyrI-like domain-containing protein [Chloroflexota bacterium]